MCVSLPRHFLHLRAERGGRKRERKVEGKRGRWREREEGGGKERGGRKRRGRWREREMGGRWREREEGGGKEKREEGGSSLTHACPWSKVSKHLEAM